jgi:hypothetical protein
MNKLNHMEKIVLWASIEDFTDLAWLPSELENVQSFQNKESLKDKSKEICRQLLERKFVDLYRRDMNLQFSDEAFIKVEFSEALDIINESKYWELENLPVRFYIASTGLGEETYYENY